jgi:hypothetical protein
MKNMVLEEYCGSWGSFTHPNQLMEDIEKLREEYLQLQRDGTSIPFGGTCRNGGEIGSSTSALV